MTPPDEVRAAFEALMLARGTNITKTVDGEGYAFGHARTAWDAYQSAYASGSAARKERDVRVLRGEIAFRENARHPEAGISGFVDFNRGLHKALELLENDKC